MNPAQEQLMAQFGRNMQQIGGEAQGLIQQALTGCAQMIAQNPTDPIPLANALGAIEQQYKQLSRKIDDSLGDFYDKVCEAGSGEPAYSRMKAATRAYDRWMEESWQRFDAHIHGELYRAMWPHTQQAMTKGAACNRCGGPLRRTTPQKTESIACAGCRTVNNVMPEAVVATYFSAMPHYFAEAASMEKRFAIRKMKDDWEDHRDAEHAADRDRPEEPIERLRQREQMEKDYWTTYAETRVRYEGGTPEEVRTLVESRMKQAFYDEMNLNDVWRRANGMQGVREQVRVPAHLANVDDWGPVGHPQQNQNALEDDMVHDQLLSEALREPDRHDAMLKAMGYRDATHRAQVHHTFMRYYGEWLTTNDGQQLITRAAMRAMNERMKYLTAAGASSGLLDPIEGVSIATYANLQAKQAGVSQDEFQKLLAQHQMDMPKWEKVAKGWIDRMSRDTTGVVATEYAKGFAGQGQYGAMGAAAADNMGQMGMAAPSAAAEPISFEKYCEISGAMAAWSKQGKDISASLNKHFQMTAMDVSNVSMYWSQKMMADLSMFQTQSEKTAQYEQKYLAMG